MRKYKINIIIVLFIITIIAGVFTINVRYTRISGRFDENSIYNVFSSNSSDVLSEQAFYGAVKLSKNKDMAVYLNPKPFDFRISIGNHILYINKKAIDNIKNNINMKIDEIRS